MRTSGRRSEPRSRVLVLSGKATTSETDALGRFKATVVAFAKATAPSSVVMEAEYKTYENDAGVIVFTQRFPNGLSEQDTTRRNGLSARTVFPSFQRSKLDCFAYHGVFPAMKGCTLSTYKETHAGGAPLTIYDGANGSLPMTVFLTTVISVPYGQHR